MNSNIPVKTRTRKFSFRGLSIQQRLPLLICMLLICIVVALGWLSQLGVKKAALAMGKERLETLTEQLCSLFGQSAAATISATHTAASQHSIKNYLYANTPDSTTAIQQLMDKLRLDSNWVLVELLDVSRRTLVRSAPAGSTIQFNSRESLSAGSLSPDSCKVGKFFQVKDTIYYPIVAAVAEKNKTIGYLVRWRRQTATPKALAQLSQLLGTNAVLSVGNRDGSLWTDMIRPITAPPVDIAYEHHIFEYTRQQEGPVIATAGSIPNTPWIVLIEFSEGVIMEPSRRFFPWVITIGAVLVVIGMVLAWITSRNITRPLHDLTAATAAMAAGDYTVSVEAERSDELGELARAFNAMAVKVKTAQHTLEQTVEERTQQLHAAIKELEAFSYSVSHDLRSPLRAISGYASILNEDYAPGLDAEAGRITGKIITNARNMGQLIDDLISFSQLSRKELKQQVINMEELAKSCLDELLQDVPANKYKVLIHPMPAARGDKGLIKQVWINLISNAIKYTSKNETPVVEIGYGKDVNSPYYFISDNGAGFDMQYADKLFGVFQRLHSQNEFEGAGIGLSLVKSIITRHNGQIIAKAAVGKGASFYFSLP